MALEIIRLIDGAKSLNRLVKVWNAEEQAEADGLSLTEFLRVMLKVLPSEDDSREGQLSLVESLVEMFKSVDVNGDRSMEWAEFSSFIAEMGLTATLPSSAAPVRVSYREREGFIDMTNQRALDKVEVVEWPPVAPPASEAVKMALSGGRAPKPQRPIEFWTLESESATVRVWEAGKRPTLQDPSGGTAPPGGDKHSEQTKADVAVILGIDPSKEPKMTKQQKLDAEMINPRTAKQAAALRGATSLAPMRLKYEINITASASTPAGGGSASRAGHTKQLAAGRSAATGRAASRRGWAAGVGEDDDGEDGGKAGGAAGASDSKSRREKHAGKVDKIPEPSIQAWQFMWDQKLLAIAQSDCRISVWNLPSGGPPGPLPGLRPGAPIDSGERVGGSGIGGAGGAGGGDSGARSGRKPRRLPQGGFSQFDSIITRGPPSALAYCRQLLYATDTIGKGSIVAYHIPSMQLVHRWQPHGDRIPCILALTPRALGFSRATGSSSSTAGPGARLPGGSPRSTITVSSARSRGVAGAPVETAAAGSGGLLVTASLDGTVRCMHLAAPLETVVGEFNRRKRAERALGRAADGDHKTGSADDSAADAAGSDDDEAPLAAAAAGASPGGSSSNLASLLAKRKRIEVGETSADGKPQYPMVPEVSGGSETVHKLSPHPRGARHLCFLAAEGLLVTAGFDQDAMAFELPAGRLKLTLKGHRHPIVQAREVWQGHNGIGLGGAGLQAIPRPKPPSMRRSAADVVDGGAEAGGNASGELVHSRCLTLDQSSCFRLWDMRPNPTGLAACLLQFDTGSAMPGSFTSYRSHCFGVTRWSGDLVVGGTKLHHLVPLAHANEISSPAIVVYNPLSHCFYVMGGARATSAGSVRVYDAKRGVLSRTFPDMSPAPVTVASLDDRQRKLIVGTQGGDVTVHNAASGGLMKSLDKAHPTGSEITAMEYVVGTKLLLTASWDRTVRLFDEDPPHACVGVRSVARAHDADITAASASNNLVLMASADALSFVKVWDMETLKLDGACIGHGGGIQCVQFVEPYPLLLVADKEGRVVMWGMRGTSKGALYQPVVLLQNHSRKQEEATNLQLDPGHEHVTDDKDQESAAAAGSAAGSDEVDAGGMRDGAAPGRGGTASALGEQEPRKAVPVTSMVQTFWPFDIDPSSKHGSAYLPGDTSGDIAAVRQGLGLPPLGAGEGVEAQASAEMHSPAAFHKEARTGRAVPAKGHGGARRALVLGDENGWITVVDLTAMIQRTRVQAFVRGAGDGQDGRPSSTASKHGVELAMARRMSADITAAGARLRTAPQARTAGTAAAARRLSVSMPGASLPMATVDGSTAAAAEVIGTREEEEAAVRRAGEGRGRPRHAGAGRGRTRVGGAGGRAGGRRASLTGADAAAAGRQRRRSLLKQAHSAAVSEMRRPVIGESMQSPAMMGLDMEAEELVGGSHRADRMRKRAQAVATQILTNAGAGRGSGASGKKSRQSGTAGSGASEGDIAGRVAVVGNQVVRQVDSDTVGVVSGISHGAQHDFTSHERATPTASYRSAAGASSTTKPKPGHARRRRRRNSILASGNDDGWAGAPPSRAVRDRDAPDDEDGSAFAAVNAGPAGVDPLDTDAASPRHTSRGLLGSGRSRGSPEQSPGRGARAGSDDHRAGATQQLVFEGMAKTSVFVPLSHTGVDQAIAEADSVALQSRRQLVSAERERMVRQRADGARPGSSARGASAGSGLSRTMSPQVPSLGGSPPSGRARVARSASGSGSPPPGSRANAGGLYSDRAGSPGFSAQRGGAEGDGVSLEQAAKAAAARAAARARDRWEEAMQQHREAVQERMQFVDATPSLWGQPLACWKAHEGGISQVVAIKDPPSIVTSGEDGSVKVWSMRGTLLGVILASRRELALERLGLAKHPEWQFHWDESREQRIKRQEARQALRLLAEEDEGKSRIRSAAAKDNDAVMDDAIVLSRYLGTGEAFNPAAGQGPDGPAQSSGLSEAPSAFELGGDEDRDGDDDDNAGGSAAKFRSLEDLERAAIASAISHVRQLADDAAAVPEGSPSAGGGTGLLGSKRIATVAARRLTRRAQSSMKLTEGSTASSSPSPNAAAAASGGGGAGGGNTPGAAKPNRARRRSALDEEDDFGMMDAESRLKLKEEQWQADQLASSDAANVLRARAAFAAARAGAVESVAKLCGVKRPEMEGTHQHLLSGDGVMVGLHKPDSVLDLASTGGIPVGSFEAIVRSVGLRPPERPPVSKDQRPAAVARALEKRCTEHFRTAQAAVSVLQRLLAMDVKKEARGGRLLWQGEGTALPLPEELRRSILLSNSAALLAVSMTQIEQAASDSDDDDDEDNDERGANVSVAGHSAGGSMAGSDGGLSVGAGSFVGMPLSARARIILADEDEHADASDIAGLDDLDGVGLVDSDSDDLDMQRDLTETSPTHQAQHRSLASSVRSGAQSSAHGAPRLQLPSTGGKVSVHATGREGVSLGGGSVAGRGRGNSRADSNRSSSSNDMAASASKDMTEAELRKKKLRRVRTLERVRAASRLALLFGKSKAGKSPPTPADGASTSGFGVGARTPLKKGAQSLLAAARSGLPTSSPQPTPSPLSHSGSRSTLAPPPSSTGSRKVGFSFAAALPAVPSPDGSTRNDRGTLPSSSRSPSHPPLVRKPSLGDALKEAVTAQQHEESRKSGGVARDLTVGRALIRKPRQSRRLQGTLKQLATITDRERYLTESGAVATTEEEMREPSALRVGRGGRADGDEPEAGRPGGNKEGAGEDHNDEEEETDTAELLKSLGGSDGVALEDDSDLRELLDVMGAGKRAAELLEDHLRGSQQVAIESTYDNLREAVAEKRGGGAGVRSFGGRQLVNAAAQRRRKRQLAEARRESDREEKSVAGSHAKLLCWVSHASSQRTMSKEEQWMALSVLPGDEEEPLPAPPPMPQAHAPEDSARREAKDRLKSQSLIELTRPTTFLAQKLGNNAFLKREQLLRERLETSLKRRLGPTFVRGLVPKDMPRVTAKRSAAAKRLSTTSRARDSRRLPGLLDSPARSLGTGAGAAGVGLAASAPHLPMPQPSPMRSLPPLRDSVSAASLPGDAAEQAPSTQAVDFIRSLGLQQAATGISATRQARIVRAATAALDKTEEQARATSSRAQHTGTDDHDSSTALALAVEMLGGRPALLNKEEVFLQRTVRRLGGLRVVEGARDAASALRSMASPLRAAGRPGKAKTGLGSSRSAGALAALRSRGYGPDGSGGKDDGGALSLLESAHSGTHHKSAASLSNSRRSFGGSTLSTSMTSLVEASRLARSGQAGAVQQAMQAMRDIADDGDDEEEKKQHQAGADGGGGAGFGGHLHPDAATSAAAAAAVAGFSGTVATSSGEAVAVVAAPGSKKRGSRKARSRIDTSAFVAKTAPRKAGSKPPTVFHGSVLATDVDAAADLFHKFDADGSGEVDAKEFLDSGLWDSASGGGGMSGSVFNTLDEDGSGEISLKEYLKAVFAAKLKSAQQLADIVAYASERGKRKAERTRRELEAALKDDDRGRRSEASGLQGSEGGDFDDDAESPSRSAGATIWKRIAGPRAAISFQEVVVGLTGFTTTPAASAGAAGDSEANGSAVRERHRQMQALEAAAGVAGIDLKKAISAAEFQGIMESMQASAVAGASHT